LRVTQLPLAGNEDLPLVRGEATRRTRPASHPRVAALVAFLVAALGGCGADRPLEPDGLVDQETFIATYVDLRAAMLGTRDDSLAEVHRNEALERRGLSAEDLVAFVEFHAADLEYMRAVWDEVEVRLDTTRVRMDPDAR